jgi:hypothetical protein
MELRENIIHIGPIEAGLDDWAGPTVDFRCQAKNLMTFFEDQLSNQVSISTQGNG